MDPICHRGFCMHTIRRLSLTGGQLDIINNLAKASKERMSILENFLRENGKSEVTEFSMKEASDLIDRLRAVRAERVIEHYLTQNQLIFLDQLQDTPARREHTGSFLELRKKQSIHSLSSSEASELIAVLKTMKPPSEGEKLDAPLTVKQMDIINDLQDTEIRVAETERYLNQVVSKDLRHLTREEADELISRLE